MIQMHLGALPTRTYNPDANAIEGEVGFKTFWDKVTGTRRPGRRPTKVPRGFIPPGWGGKVPGQGGKPVPDQGGRRPGFSPGNGGGAPTPADPIPTLQASQAEIDALHAEIRGCMADFNHSPRCRLVLAENALCATPQGAAHHDCREAQLPVVGGSVPGTQVTVEPTDTRTWFQKYGKLSMGAIGAGILAVGVALIAREG